MKYMMRYWWEIYIYRIYISYIFVFMRYICLHIWDIYIHDHGLWTKLLIPQIPKHIGMCPLRDADQHIKYSITKKTTSEGEMQNRGREKNGSSLITYIPTNLKGGKKLEWGGKKCSRLSPTEVERTRWPIKQAQKSDIVDLCVFGGVNRHNFCAHISNCSNSH